MPNDRISRTALAVSLLLHAALVAPVWSGLLPVGGAPLPAPEPAREPLTFHFVDPQPEAVEAPPSELLSTTDARAAQPEAPAELPPGAAFSAGRTPL
ncbi:MAG TPA: hypothetical protein VM778_09520, partial [Gemmatimonadota bacterium]|nr:hypothetical protein [Gemmatimonadota bacterium]